MMHLSDVIFPDHCEIEIAQQVPEVLDGCHADQNYDKQPHPLYTGRRQKEEKGEREGEKE